MSITALPLTDVETAEDRLHRHLRQLKTTSLGSEYVAFYTSPDDVIALADSDLVNAFRRVVLDAARGLVILMTPGMTHETTSSLVDDFINLTSDIIGLKIVNCRSTRWRREYEPKNTGNEPDCSFYFGEKAEGYIDAVDTNEEAEEAYVERNPPDLVVEVEVTHMSRDKQQSYRDKGVAEFWQLASSTRRQWAVTFLDLQAAAGPQPVSESLNLPGITPVHVEAAVRQFLRKDMLSYSARSKLVEGLINSLSREGDK